MQYGSLPRLIIPKKLESIFTQTKITKQINQELVLKSFEGDGGMSYWNQSLNKEISLEEWGKNSK